MNILGGIDTITGGETMIITTVGGFDKYLQPKTQNVVVGNLTKTFVKNKHTEWSTFKDVYFKNGKLDPKYYDKFITVMNYIFPIPVNTDNDKDLLYMLDTLYKASDEQIINAMNNFLNLMDPFKQSLRHLFMIWKIYLEKLVEIFVELRKKYIDEHKLQKKNKTNDFKSMVEQWVAIDLENKVNTSSPILFFNFPSREVYMDKSIPKIEWRINGANKEISDLIDKFLNKIETKKFTYFGFCVNAVIVRFQLLLSFPFDILLDTIEKIDTHNKYDKINKCAGHVINEITKLRNKICEIKDTKSGKLNRKKVPSKKKFPNSHNDKVKFYEKYIEAFLDIYQQLMPYFIKKEKLMCELSLKVNIISNDIQKLISEFDKLINES